MLNRQLFYSGKIAPQLSRLAVAILNSKAHTLQMLVCKTLKAAKRKPELVLATCICSSYPGSLIITIQQKRRLIICIIVLHLHYKFEQLPGRKHILFACYWQSQIAAKSSGLLTYKE